MENVFILEHTYELDDIEETKFIGVYTSEILAKEAIERLKSKPGFCSRPENFVISKQQLNQDSWTEGFSTMTTIMISNKNKQWQPVQAEILDNENYQIFELHDNDSLDEFKHLDIVKCEERDGILYAVQKKAE